MSIALPMLRDRDRVLLVEPGRLHPAVSFARASTATYMGPAGSLLTAAVNAPRFEYDSIGNYLGLLIEEARTNALLNSATLSTQSVTVTTAARTLSFCGTGTVTLSGAFSGSLIGTGASNRVTLTFTPTAGTLTLTVSGSVTSAQLETGAFATSYIPTTSAAVTRSADVPIYSGPINASAGTLFVDTIYDQLKNTPSEGSFTGVVNNGFNGVGTQRWYNGSSNVTSGNSTPVGSRRTSIFAYTSATRALCLNGGSVVSDNNVPWSSGMPTGVIIGWANGASISQCFNGHIKRLIYYPRRRPDSELQRMTA